MAIKYRHFFKVNSNSFDRLAVVNLAGFALGITFLSLAVLTQFDLEFQIDDL